MNYYSVLGINKEKFTKEYLDEVYKHYLNEIEEGLKRYSNNEEKIRKIEKMRSEITIAYEILSDDAKRKEHDEYLKEVNEFNSDKEENLDSKNDENQKREFITKFEKNQILKYKPSLIKNLNYHKSEYEKFEYIDKENGRRIVIEELGNLQFKTALNLKYPEFKRYQVTVKDILANKVEIYKIFTTFSKLQFMQDEEYSKFLGTVLFSDENLRIASNYNGGYVGEIQENNNEFKVIHDEDCLSAAIEFNKRLRGAVNKIDRNDGSR